MIYDIKAIPTTYAGVQFRSRLEARWAAFFDLCGWKWDYEPFDLDGWAPDFMLKGKIKSLVEVKPINFSEVEHIGIAQAKEAANKAFKTAYKARHDPKTHYEILVIGNGPFSHDHWYTWSLGIMALEKWCCGEDFADLYWGKTQNIDYAARYGNYAYRIGGQWNGDHHLSPIKDDTPEQLWREAGNAVQWRPDEAHDEYSAALKRLFGKAA